MTGLGDRSIGAHTTRRETVMNAYAVNDEYGHLSRRNLSVGDVKRFLRRTGDATLPQWDNSGYPVAYYVAQPAMPNMSRSHREWTGFVNGEIAVAQYTGDVLCGQCAAIPMFDEFEIVVTAYQCNGEIGDEDTVTCDHCGREIYNPED